MINGIESKDPQSIEKDVFSFYSTLYSSNYSVEDAEILLNRMRGAVPRIEESFRDVCDADLKIEELDSVCLGTALNTSPGTDGLTSHFHLFFWKELRELLYLALKECILDKELMTTMKRGLITLIPKSGKDKRRLDHLRPITLLNTEYKILSGVTAARVKKGAWPLLLVRHSLAF